MLKRKRVRDDEIVPVPDKIRDRNTVDAEIHVYKGACNTFGSHCTYIISKETSKNWPLKVIFQLKKHFTVFILEMHDISKIYY